MKHVGLIVLLVTVLLAACGADAGRNIDKAGAVKAAETWLQQIDDGKYAESWNGASDFFKNALPEDAWVGALNGMRPALGVLQSRQKKSANVLGSLPNAPSGTYVVILFNTVFETKGGALETVTMMLGADDIWRSAGYFVK